MMFGQLDPIVQKAVADALGQPPKSDAQYMIWLFVVALLIFGGGGFYVLRYMLMHAKEIHETSHKTISSLSQTFTAECNAQRDQHHKDMVMSRDNVHDIRDVSQIAITAKEFAEELQRRQAIRQPPPNGTA